MMTWPDFKYRQIIVHRTISRGEKLHFLADTIVISDSDGKTLLRHSCHRLFALFIIGECSLTSAVIRQAVKFAFPIIMMTANLKVVAKINCAAEGNTALRKLQYYSGERNLQIAIALISQKISNQKALLLALRHPSADDKQALRELSELQILPKISSKELLGIEGSASRIFFRSYFRPLGWTRREPRCKHDIYNLLLDIGYTYLFNFIDALLSLYGFDTYCGVFHTFFYQRKSLVCDLVEPFRCIIDRRLRKAYNLGQIDPDDFIFSHGEYMLPWKNTSKYTALFLKDILSEKEVIFKFIQVYYRWFMRQDGIEFFPVYNILEGE